MMDIEIDNISERIQDNLSVCDSIVDRYKNEQYANININMNKNQNKVYLKVPNSLIYRNDNRWSNSNETEKTNFETDIIEVYYTFDFKFIDRCGCKKKLN